MFKTYIKKLITWYLQKATSSWSRELANLKNNQDGQIWLILSFGFTLFLFIYLLPEAFSISILTGLSFLWATFIAISFGYILRSPLLLILVYVGVLFSREITGIFIAAKDAATVGDILGAIILIAFGIYLTAKANDMKSGAILLESRIKTKVGKVTRKRRKGNYRRKR